MLTELILDIKVKFKDGVYKYKVSEVLSDNVNVYEFMRREAFNMQRDVIDKIQEEFPERKINKIKILCEEIEEEYISKRKWKNKKIKVKSNGFLIEVIKFKK